jgi:hypothetical protein
MSSLVTEEDKKRFLEEFVHVTDEQIEEAKCVKQRTPSWHRFKRHRIGMSMAGAAAGHNEHKTPDRLLVDMLWGSDFSNDATEYGNIMEDTGLSMMQIVLRSHFTDLGYGDVWVESTGTWIWKEHPWLSASSDGLIYVVDGPEDKPTLFGTAENKAPYGLRAYPSTPHYYYDQFQGTAIIVNAEFIIFNVYTPASTQVNWFDVDREYWMNEVFPKLEQFYMGEYLWRAILKDRGLIKPGHINPEPLITVNLSLLKGAGAKRKTTSKKPQIRKRRSMAKMIAAAQDRPTNGVDLQDSDVVSDA